MKNILGQFKLNDYVEICSDSSYFNGKKGNIISNNELTGSMLVVAINNCKT